MSESEQREIEEAAELVDFSNHAPDAHEVEFMRIGYIAGATAIAEKKNSQLDSRTLEWGKVLKIRDETIFHLESINTALADHNENYLTQLEAAQEELEKEKKGHVQLSEMYQTALQKYVERGAELERVKEVAKMMQSALLHRSEKMTTEALTEFANLMNKEK